MKLAKPAAHSVRIFRITAALQIQILAKLSKLRRMGLYKFHLFLFSLLYKGIVFHCQPSVAISHILLLVLQISIGFLNSPTFSASDFISVSSSAFLAVRDDSAALLLRHFIDNASACESEHSIRV
jgi:ABC-type uncharacterized transport system permease subunit